MVTLPLNATEDCVTGGIDFNRAVKTGKHSFQPGLLARVHRGVLYVDEVNLLDDHVVDVLLDSAAMGVVTIEREGVSFSHAARFTLVGTINPEEGELRPQLLDRFGLCVHIEGITEPEARVAVMERRTAFDENPETFYKQWEEESQVLVKKIKSAIDILPQVAVEREHLFEIANYCLDIGVDGHRGDIIILKTARTMAAFHGRKHLTMEDIEEAASLALPHCVRRQPLQDIVVDVKDIRKHHRSIGNA